MSEFLHECARFAMSVLLFGVGGGLVVLAKSWLRQWFGWP